MANQRFWAAIPSLSFISNGGTEGQVSILSTHNVKVKMLAYIKSDTQPQKQYEVKAVLNSTDLVLGPKGGAMRGKDSTVDVSAYLTLDNSVFNVDIQERPNIILNEIDRAVYEEEPTMAIRTIDVDPFGKIRSDDNPIPTKNISTWDTADISRDSEDDITKVEFSKNSSIVETINLKYNGEKSIIKVTKT